MRHLLHLGLFAAVLAATAHVSADDDSDDRRERRVVAVRDYHPRPVRTVRVETPPVRVVYDTRRPHPVYRRAAHDRRRDFYEAQQDLEQIRRIARRWERAVSYGDFPAMRMADARLDAWLDRELYEARRDPHGDRYAHRIRVLRDELAFLEQRARYGRGHPGRGHKYGWRHANGRAYGHVRGYPGLYFDEKVRIFDQLIRLSERQVQRARANLDRPVMWSYGYR